MNGSPGNGRRRYQTLTPGFVRTSPLATERMAPGRGVARVPMAGGSAAITLVLFAITTFVAYMRHRVLPIRARAAHERS